MPDRWNDTAHDVPAVTLPDLFEAQVRRTPDAEAVRFADESLTYREFGDRVGRLALLLAEHGVTRGSVVAVDLERSVELVVALHAIHRAGAAYLPLADGDPVERVRHQVSDTAAVTVLTVAARAGRFARELVIDSAETAADLERLGAGPSAHRPSHGATPSTPAYVIYTSGSTGRPKGVVIPHSAIVNRLCWMQDTYAIGVGDRVLQKTPYTFDVSVWEFFWPLMTGAVLVVARPGGHRDPRYLADLIRRERITVTHFVPSMLDVFLDEPTASGCPSLALVICSGEALSADLRDRFFRTSSARLENLYGPTEAAVDVTWFSCGPDDTEQVVPIGRPVWNTTAHVLDDELRETTEGELYLGGDQLAIGYLDRPGLTAERFVPNPFGRPGSRLYRTGDLAHRRPDGAIEYLGRTDDQIKIRGMRVEPGEIEAALTSFAGVGRAAVTVHEGVLSAHVVPDRTRAAAVRNQLAGGFAHDLQRAGPDVVMFGHSRAEAEFLYEEIFGRREYLRGGVTLAPDAVVFDVGAHIGYFALQLSQECPQGTVYCFEPIPELFELLTANCALHEVNARLINCGIADERGTDTFTYYPGLSIMSGRFAESSADRAVVEGYLRNGAMTEAVADDDLHDLLTERLRGNAVTCELRTISDVVDEHGVDRIDLLKIDAEKSELDVLRGVRAEHWPMIQQVVAEVHDEDGRLAGFLALLRGNGFTVEVDVPDPLRDTGLVTVSASRGATAVPAPVRKWSVPEVLVEDVLAHLRDHLPDHMVPASVTLLGELPLTSSGKLDRRALPGRTVAAPAAIQRTANGIREHALCELFADALKRPVAPDDNVQHLGAHSLLIAKLTPRIRAALGGAVTVSDILREPTVANLVKLADAPSGGAFEPVLPLRLHGKLPPLYCVHGADGLGWDYWPLLDDPAFDRPVYALQSHGVASTSAAGHVAQIRRIQRRGPYHLCGTTSGSALTQEIAALLRADGHEVSVVAVDDPPPVTSLFGTTR